MGYSRYEQETSIVWDEEEKVARIYTASPVTIRRIDKLCEACPETYKCVWVQSDGLAKKYEVNKRFIRFGKPATQAQIERGRMIAAKIHEKKNEAI